MKIQNKFNPSVEIKVTDGEQDKYQVEIRKFVECPVFQGVLQHAQKKYGNLQKIEVGKIYAGGTLDNDRTCYDRMHYDYIAYGQFTVTYRSFNGYTKNIRYYIRLRYGKTEVSWKYGDDEFVEYVGPECDTPEKVAERMDYVSKDDGIYKKLASYIKRDSKNEFKEENRKNNAAIDNMELFSELESIAKFYGLGWEVKQDRFTEIFAKYGNGPTIKLTCTDKAIKVDGGGWCWPAGMLDAITGAMGVTRIPSIPYCDGEKAKAVFRFLCAYVKKTSYKEWDEYAGLTEALGK